MEAMAFWGDVATWVTGVASIALFIIAFIQIRVERNSRTEREREQESQRKRTQAELVSSWLVYEIDDLDGRPTQWIAVLNQSHQPVYQLVIGVVVLANEGQRVGGPIQREQVCIAVAPPGKGYVKIHSHYHGMMKRPGIEIGFMDAAGNSWIRKSNGELLEIGKSPARYYEIDLPTSWINLMPDLPQG